MLDRWVRGKVSIHAPLHREERPEETHAPAPTLLFQSTPLSIERSDALDVWQPAPGRFQSTPLSIERSDARDSLRSISESVSIHAPLHREE